MKHAESAVSTLQTLRERGVKVAVDNLCTGYSRLSYLRKFPVGALKIDQSIVHQISNPDEDPAIVTAVIDMARSLKLRVVAEGVESWQSWNFFKRTNVMRRKGAISPGRCHPSSSRGCSVSAY